MERTGEAAEWPAQGLLVAELNGYLFHPLVSILFSA